MIRPFTFAITLLLLLGSMGQAFGQSETGFVSLFNGKDLTGTSLQGKRGVERFVMVQRNCLIPRFGVSYS